MVNRLVLGSSILGVRIPLSRNWWYSLVGRILICGIGDIGSNPIINRPNNRS